jgi:hypothetical protein
MAEQNRNLIITGSAPCVLLDIGAVSRVCSYDYMAIGLDAVDKYVWPIRYCATYHPAEIQQIRKKREIAGGNSDYQIISMEPHAGVDIVEPFRPPSGSSALLGALAGLRLGYRRIVLCGCPLDDLKYKAFRAGWETFAGELAGRVRSMSGWTKDFLGAPTDEWLLGGGCDEK